VILFPPLSPESRRILDGVPDLIEKIFPVPKRFRPSLPRDVAELSRLLTSGRGDRGASYPGQPRLLSAYLRYFLPWNLYRLCRLLPALSLSLDGGVTDLGSGPLTLPAALWIARPELRELPLEFRCVDRSAAVLEAGKQFFAALTGQTRPGGSPAPWKLKLIKAALGSPVHGPPAGLVSAVNVFNELYEDIPHRGSLRPFADKQARLLSSLTAEGGSVLVVEPGLPRSGEFIAALRASLVERGRKPVAPCPHAGTCPCPGGKEPGGGPAKTGGKGRWCHFAFETLDAAPALLKLSAAAPQRKP
jgi:ribosomal protein RSM22 (predicted rRNA methylase)